MASTLFSRTISGNTETAISMSNCTWARPIIIPSTWSKLRIGVRFDFTNTGGDLTSTPRFGLGLCSGTTQLVGDATTKYFVGVVSTSATWSWAGAFWIYYNWSMAPATKSGSVLSVGTDIAADVRVNNNPAGWNTFYFVDITKGSPNYTFNTYTNKANNPNAINSSDLFQNQVALASPSMGGGYSFGTDRTMYVDEATSGSLNAVTCWWNRSDAKLIMEDVAVALLA